MGKRSRKRHSRDTDSESGDDSESPLTSPSESESKDSDRSSKRRRHRHRKDRSSSRREKDRSSKRRKKERRERDRDRKRSKSRRQEEKRKSKRRDYSSEEDESQSSGHSDSEPEQVRVSTESALRDMLVEFPKVADDLKQLLKMIDDGQAVDINGISERALIKHLKKLFVSLNLKEKSGVFLLPSNGHPVLETVIPLIDAQSVKDSETVAVDVGGEPLINDDNAATVCGNEAPSVRRRVVGPEMPSAELLAAAAKLTEAQAELREAELEEEDNGLFIGPAPPAMVAEAASVNEAERFEEVTRIMAAEEGNPYDVVGANHKMATENIKKRYWKLSLLVHPDKCPHPQAQQAFVKLNKAFKDLQDPDKRKALDDKIKIKEEEEAFKVELQAMREAAQWRKLQGISMEGDEELLAEVNVHVAPKREEWMTTLPPERKPGGMPMQSTQFSMTTKQGRGDTSIWTDTPSERAQKAKMNYLEAYNEASALMSNEMEKNTSKDAELVDMYNKAKRSKSLVQKHQEESTSSRSKKKSKQPQPTEKEKGEWVGNHPWKPWDREKDLTAGRQKVKLDAEGMAEGLTSRFLSGNFQRSFL